MFSVQMVWVMFTAHMLVIWFTVVGACDSITTGVYICCNTNIIITWGRLFHYTLVHPAIHTL